MNVMKGLMTMLGFARLCKREMFRGDAFSFVKLIFQKDFQK